MIPGAVGGRAEAGAGDPGAGAEAGEVGVTAGGAGVNPHPGNQGYYLIFVFLLLINYNFYYLLQSINNLSFNFTLINKFFSYIIFSSIFFFLFSSF